MVRAAALAFAAFTQSQGAGPAKMVLISNQGVAVTDFASMTRCEAARQSILRAVAAANAALAPSEVLPGGGVIVALPTETPKMFCVRA